MAASEFDEVLERALDAVERLMRMFRAERIVYLVAAAASFGLLFYAAFLMFAEEGVDAASLGLIFGATGLSAVSAGRIAFFLNRAFKLIEDVVRERIGMGGRADG